MRAFGATLYTKVQEGGWVMYVLLLVSIGATAVIIYKYIVFKKVKIDTTELVGQVRTHVLQGNHRGAVESCEGFQGPIAAILKAGLLKYESTKSKEEIEKTIENSALHEVAILEKGLVILSSIATIAPLIGFLGTVVGMIQSFDVIAEQGLNNPGAVAKGISVALLTTAFGLIVAIPTQSFYNFFTTNISTFIREMETSSNILIETFQESERFAQRPAVTSGSAG
ncbi:MAG: MotA/TolQ/ExbB proton channel family protein [Acidobacteria bacterium]|nr:MotA/TolQ/ExbB proton channel family protein [Acidobacteriota bacterium]